MARAIGAALLLLSIGACKGEGGSRSAPAAVPAELDAVRDRIAASGIHVSELEPLRSLRELPECPEARFRWRIHLGEENGFANVSRFEAASLAQACYQGFRSMALKGGAHAWEKLRRDLAVEGSWLILFPPDGPSEESRRAIVRAVAGR